MCKPQKKQIIATATDPIYIGTGGFTIGRVDNTIVRDPITKIPKIPGSSLAGTWRYYMALELQSYFKEEYRKDRAKRKEHKDAIGELFDKPKDWVKSYAGNRFAAIKCAGQDDTPNVGREEEISDTHTGHCGHCIVCQAFGFSKKNISKQGMLFFSDLNILFFPVYTMQGIKWISSKRMLDQAGILTSSIQETDEAVIIHEENSEKTINHINLGWLYLSVERRKFDLNLDNTGLDSKDIIIVPDNLISQIINSNLEVRTSVSIDPITGSAKEGALFTSEAIPRGTIFYTEINIFEKQDDNLPNAELVKGALEASKQYYESLGIGGMSTRGYGRMKIHFI